MEQKLKKAMNSRKLWFVGTFLHFALSIAAVLYFNLFAPAPADEIEQANSSNFTYAANQAYSILLSPVSYLVPSHPMGGSELRRIAGITSVLLFNSAIWGSLIGILYSSLRRIGSFVRSAD